MIEQKYYTSGFYNEQQAGSYESAKEILVYINKIFHPGSVVDVGCGVGYWLKVWKEKYNIADILGIEGPYISAEMLKIPKEYVNFLDLKSPILVNRKFDLAMSLEVAEHLPEASADSFIQSLTRLSNCIVFSAAIPGQEGTFHINEQMPEYWAAKFKKFDFEVIDYLRPLIWNNEKIDWWYRQNILIFMHKDQINNYPDLYESYKTTFAQNLFRVQPWLYFHKDNHIAKTKSFIGFMRWKLFPVKKFFKKIIGK